MPATKTLDQRLDDLVGLDHQELDQLIGRTEAKLTLLRALRGLEAPNGHMPPPPVSKPLKPQRPTKKRKTRAGDSNDLDDYEDPPVKPESAGSRAANKLGRQRSIAHLLKKGPMALSDLSRETAIGTSTLWNLMKSPWFTQTVKGGPYSLTDEGHAEISKRKPDVTTLKASPKPKISAGELPVKLGEFLKANGPKRSDAIRNALGCDMSALEGVLEHPWFEKDGAMYRLSADGHTHFSAGQEP